MLVSVHLKPGAGSRDTRRRITELNSISSWVNANNSIEKDFFILGDIKFKTCTEITAIRPIGFTIGALEKDTLKLIYSKKQM